MGGDAGGGPRRRQLPPSVGRAEWAAALLPALALLLMGLTGAAGGPEATPLPKCPSQRLRGSDFDDTGFGNAVALTEEFLVGGAPGDYLGTGPGSAYVYFWSGHQWTLATTFTNSPSPVNGDRFGTALAMEREAVTGVTYLVVTAPGTASAALFVHPPNLAASEWPLASRWPDPIGITQQFGTSGFGQSVALSGRFLAFGVSWDAWRGGNYALFERARASADGQSDGWARAASSKSYDEGSFSRGSGVALAASSVSASPAYMLVGSPRDNLEYKHASGASSSPFPPSYHSGCFGTAPCPCKHTSLQGGAWIKKCV